MTQVGRAAMSLIVIQELESSMPLKAFWWSHRLKLGAVMLGSSQRQKRASRGTQALPIHVH